MFNISAGDKFFQDAQEEMLIKHLSIRAKNSEEIAGERYNFVCHLLVGGFVNQESEKKLRILRMNIRREYGV